MVFLNCLLCDPVKRYVLRKPVGNPLKIHDLFFYYVLNITAILMIFIVYYYMFAVC